MEVLVTPSRDRRDSKMELRSMPSSLPIVNLPIELNDYGGLSCTFWGKLSNYIYKLAREERLSILFIFILCKAFIF
jgi:hypothetical protein